MVTENRVQWYPSDNFGARPPGILVDTVVIHYTDVDLHETFRLLTCPEHGASAHYVIARDGRLFQMVEEEHRAWHAGHSRLGARENVNNFSIGIELVFIPEIHDEYTAMQYESLIHLIDELRLRHPIRTITGHSDVALPAGRKKDPGPCFDWSVFDVYSWQSPRGSQAST